MTHFKAYSSDERSTPETAIDLGTTSRTGDSTRPVVYRLDDEPVDEMVKRAKAQIVGGGVHIMRCMRV